MKMHPKPLNRHNRHPEDCKALVTFQSMNALPVHLVMNINGKSQRIIMSKDEAHALAACLIDAAHEQ